MKKKCDLMLLLISAVSLFLFTACGSIQDTSGADKGSEFNSWEDTLYLDTYQTSSKDGNYVATIDGKKIREIEDKFNYLGKEYLQEDHKKVYYINPTQKDNGKAIQTYYFCMVTPDHNTLDTATYQFIWPDLYGCSDSEWSIDTWNNKLLELSDKNQSDRSNLKITEKESYTDREGRVWRIFAHTFFVENDDRMHTVHYFCLEPGEGNLFTVEFDGRMWREDYEYLIEKDYLELSW